MSDLVGNPEGRFSHDAAHITLQNKLWKEVIYIKDHATLETRVCGATGKEWSVGRLKNPRCGLQFGNAPGVRGFIGLIDDVSGAFYLRIQLFYVVTYFIS